MNLKMASNKFFKHPTSIVNTKSVGPNTKIWQYSVLQEGSIIGSNCNINFSCFIEKGVIIGNNVTVKSGIYLWNGIECEDNVFLGPNVVFTNDIFPRSKQYKEPIKTLIKAGASVGANCTILAGVTLGRYCLIGMGSVVTKDIPDYALCYGNPSKFKGWVDEDGNKLNPISSNEFISPVTKKIYQLVNNKLSPTNRNL